MFSSSPQTLPLRSRAWGVGIGTIIMVGLPIMIMSAKTVQITLPLLLAAACAWAVARRRQDLLRPRLGAASLCLLVLILYAALSAIWAPDPWAALGASLMAAAVLAGTLVLAGLLRAQDAADALHMGEGLWIGLLVGALYMTVEAASGQALKIWVYNLLALGPDMLEPARYFTWENGRLIAVHSDDLTRNIVPVPLLLWPALMTACALPAGRWRRTVVLLLLLMSIAAVFLATSETAKLALLAGFVAFAAARYLGAIAWFALAGAWTLACLGVVPLAQLLRNLGLQDADWVQLSGQMRIAQWDEIARLVPKAPLIGVGADMTYTIRPPLQAPPAAGPWMANVPIPHPHNIYLQVWYELGFVGAALLTTFGLLLLLKIKQLPGALRPFAYAMFAAAAVQIGFSYSVWQIWFMCLFSFGLAMFALGQGVHATAAGLNRITS